MKRMMIIAAAMIAAAIVYATPANADGPQVDSKCLSLQINKITTSRTGQTVRCLADDKRGYIWMIDTGEKQDPWVADQIDAAACFQQGGPQAECRSPVAVAVPLQLSTPGYTFVETKTDTMACVISQEWVNCMGEFTTTRPVQDAYTVRVTPGGSMSWLGGNIGELKNRTSLDYQIYSAQGWILSATESGTTFVNQGTGHGMFVSIDNVYAF